MKNTREEALTTRCELVDFTQNAIVSGIFYYVKYDVSDMFGHNLLQHLNYQQHLLSFPHFTSFDRYVEI